MMATDQCLVLAVLFYFEISAAAQSTERSIHPPLIRKEVRKPVFDVEKGDSESPAIGVDDDLSILCECSCTFVLYVGIELRSLSLSDHRL